jgi:LemA protein
MRKTIIIIGVIIVFALLTIFPAISTYNKMVTMDEGVKMAWSQVENVYQRRLDLIPNLVNTVKGAANFEKSTLTAVIEARAKATQVTIDPTKMTEQNMKQFQEAQGNVSSALSRLLVTVEQYPQLKATESFRDLQSQLEGTENRITVERRNFNEVAQKYNSLIRKFPKNIIASMGGFQQRPYFTAQEGASKPPSVEF